MSNPHETGLSLSDQSMSLQPIQEFGTDAAMIRAQQEVQGAMILAKKFPRNEDAAFASLMKSCSRSSFAERAEYRFPRGNKKNEETGKWEKNYVVGPSAYLIREATRFWGNIQTGTEIVRDTEDERHIRSFAWDMQTNVRRTAEVTFRKLIQRKNFDTKVTEWVRPDERDLRELHNKHAAIAERNCAAQLLPSDLIDEACQTSRETTKAEFTKDPDEAKKRLIKAFSVINITVEKLESFLGHKVSECSPAELVELRSIWSSINDGNSTWDENVAAKAEALTEDNLTSAHTVEFYNAYKKSGWATPQVVQWLKREFKVDDVRKVPDAEFERIMVFARTKATKDIPKAETTTEEKSATLPLDIPLDSEDPTQKKIVQLFDILGVSDKQRKTLLSDYAGRYGELVTNLEGQLPPE